MDDKERNEQNWAALERAMAAVRARKKPDERCAFCNEPILIMGLPSNEPITSFVMTCQCGRCSAQFKGL